MSTAPTPPRRARRAAALLLAAAAAGCLPPEPPASELAPRPRAAVRVHERPGAPALTGTLVRLTADSVLWTPAAPAGAAVRGLALADVARVEAEVPLSQRAALERGGLRGAMIGAVLGGGLLLASPDAVGGAVGLVAGFAWLGSVTTAQRAGLPHGPTRWRVVHPRPAG